MPSTFKKEKKKKTHGKTNIFVYHAKESIQFYHYYVMRKVKGTTQNTLEPNNTRNHKSEGNHLKCWI